MDTIPAPPDAPLLFVVGDSISVQYGPHLKGFVAPTLRYSRKGDGLAAGDLDHVSDLNAGDSNACVAYLRGLMAPDHAVPDLLLWNCGLHDVKTTDAGQQVPLETYARNLETGAELVRSRGVRLIWVRTTAAFEEIHNTRNKSFRRFHRDVLAYNDAADWTMRRLGVPEIDLYGFTLPFGAEAYCDHVHFTEEVRRLQAAFIAGHLLAWR